MRFQKINAVIFVLFFCCNQCAIVYVQVLEGLIPNLPESLECLATGGRPTRVDAKVIKHIKSKNFMEATILNFLYSIGKGIFHQPLSLFCFLLNIFVRNLCLCNGYGTPSSEKKNCNNNLFIYYGIVTEH